MTESTQEQAEPEALTKEPVVTAPCSPHRLESRKGKSESTTSVPGQQPFLISPFPSTALPLSPRFTWLLRTRRL